MAPSHSRNAAKGGNIKKGICQNHSYLNPDTGETGDCPKCASGEIMSVKVQRLSDFRCPVCGEKLTLVKEKNTKKIAMIAGGVVAAVAIVLGVRFIPGKEEPPVEDPGIDTLTPGRIDTLTHEGIDTVDTVKVPPVVVNPNPQGGQTENPEVPKSVLGGAAVIINEGSYKTLRFKRDYDLDLGKTDGSTLHIRAGEEINNAHITHGKLRGGNYRNLSNVEQYLQGLNVTL